MSRLLKYIEDIALERVPSQDKRNYDILTVKQNTYQDPFTPDAIRHRLYLTLGMEVIYKTPEEKDRAKQRLIEHISHFLYEDIMSLFFSLRTAVYNREFYKAASLLSEIEDIIYGR